MATTKEFVEYVCEQVPSDYEVSFRKMFGEYMVYVNRKPLLLVCDNTVYVKMLECLEEEMKDAETGFPYEGGKEHYILNIEDRERCMRVLSILEPITPVPKPRKKKNQTPKSTS